MSSVGSVELELKLNTDKFYKDLRSIKTQPLQIALDKNFLTRELSNISNKNINVGIKADISEFNNAAKLFETRLSASFTNSAKHLNKEINKSFAQTHFGGGMGGILGALTTPIRAVMRGFYEGIGGSYSQQISIGLVSNIERELGRSLSSVGEDIGKYFTGVAKRSGNAFVQRLGVEDGLAGLKPIAKELKILIDDIIDPQLLSSKLNVVEKRLFKLLDNISRLKVDKSDFLGIADAVKGVGEVPQTGLKQRRERTLREVANQIKAEYKPGEKSEDLTGKDFITLVSGGFAGAKGKSSRMVALKLQKLLGDRAYTEGVENTATDVTASIQDLGVPRWLSEAGLKIASHNVKSGINPDAIKMATRAYQLHKDNPDKQVRLAGFSAGGFVAHDAMELLKQMGVPAKAVAMGTPIWGKNSKLNPEDFISIVRELDGVVKVANIIRPLVGDLSKNLSQTTPGKDHDISLYLSEAKSQALILKQLLGEKKNKPELSSPESFRSVAHLEDADLALSSISENLSSPSTNAKLALAVASEQLNSVKIIKENLRKSLLESAENDKELITSYIDALTEAEDFLKSTFSEKTQAKINIGDVVNKQDLEIPIERIKSEDLREQFTAEGLKKIAKGLGYDSKATNKNKEQLVELLVSEEQSKLQAVIQSFGDEVKKVNYKKGVGNTRPKVNTSFVKQNIKENERIITNAIKSLDALLDREKESAIKIIQERIIEQNNNIKKLISEYEIEGSTSQVISGYRERLKSLSTQASSKMPAGRPSILGVRDFDKIEENYKRLFEAVSSLSGVSVDLKNIPKLEIDTKLKERGLSGVYNVKKNVISINKELGEILEKSDEDIQKAEKALSTLVHEIRHSLQTNFGAINFEDLGRGAKPGVNLIPENVVDEKTKLSALESLDAVTKGKRVTNKTKKAIYETEIDAYAFEKTQTKNVLQNLPPVNNVEELARVMGGSKFNLFENVGKQVNKAKSSFNDFKNDLGKLNNFTSNTSNAINASFDFLENLPELLQNINPQLANLAEGLEKFGKGFIAIALGSVAVGAIIAIGKASLSTALEVEQLENKMKMLVGVSISAQTQLQNISKTASDLNLPILETSKAYTNFYAALKGSPAEINSQKIFKDISQGFATMGLSGDAANEAYLALTQMAGKGKISSEEFIQQLAEKLPQATGVAARALGVTNAQFLKMLDSGQVLSQDFLPKFADQLASESKSGLAGASNSGTAAIVRFQNSIVNLQSSFGETLIPIQKTGLNIFSSLINLATKSSLAFTSAIGTAGFIFLKAVMPMVMQTKIAATLMSVLRTGGDAVAKSFKSIAVIFLLVATSIETFKVLSEIFGGGVLAKQFGDVTNQLKAMRAEFVKTNKELNTLDKPKGGGGWFGISDYIVDGINKINKAITGGKGTDLTTLAELDADRAKQNLNETGEQLAGMVFDVKTKIKDAAQSENLELLPDLDKQILSAQQKRNALQTEIATNFSSQGKETPLALKRQLSEVNTEINTLTKQRSGITSTFTQASKDFQQFIDTSKQQLAFLETPEALTKLGASNVAAMTEQIKEQIKYAEDNKAALDVMITNGNINPIIKMTAAFEKLNLELAKNKEASEKAYDAMKLGVATSALSEFNTNPLASKATELKSSVAELKKSSQDLVDLEQSIAKRRQEILQSSNLSELAKFNLNTESTAAEIQNAINNPKTELTDADKTILTNLKQLKDDENNLNKQRTTNAENQLRVRKAVEAESLAVIERSSAEAEALTSQTENNRIAAIKVGLSQRKMTTEQADTEIARIELSSTLRNQRRLRDELGALQTYFNMGKISAEEFEGRQRQLITEITGLNRQEAENRLELNERVKESILKAYEIEKQFDDSQVERWSANRAKVIAAMKESGADPRKVEIASTKDAVTDEMDRLDYLKRELQATNEMRSKGVLSQVEYQQKTAQINNDIVKSETSVMERRAELYQKLREARLEDIENARKNLDAQLEIESTYATIASRQKFGKTNFDKNDERKTEFEKLNQEYDKLIKQRQNIVAQSNALRREDFAREQDYKDKVIQINQELANNTLETVNNRIEYRQREQQDLRESSEQILALKKASDSTNDALSKLKFSEKINKQLAATGNKKLIAIDFEIEELKLNRSNLTKTLSTLQGELSNPNSYLGMTDNEAELKRKELMSQIYNINKQILEVDKNGTEKSRERQNLLQSQQLNLYKTQKDYELQIRESRKAVLGLMDSALDRQKQLLQSQGEYKKAVIEGAIAENEIRLQGYDQAQDVLKKSKEKDADSAYKDILSKLGLGNNETDILRNRQQMEDDIAKQKYDALIQEQALSTQLLNIDMSRQRIAAQQLVLEQKIAAERAKIAVVEAQYQLDEAKRSGDTEEIKLAEYRLAINKNILNMTNQQLASAQENLQVQYQLADNSKKTLRAQQETAMKQFQLNDRNRNIAQEIQAADLRTELNKNKPQTNDGGLATGVNQTPVQSMLMNNGSLRSQMESKFPSFNTSARSMQEMINRSSSGNSELGGKIDNLNKNLVSAVNSPRTLNVSAPEPVSSAAKIMNDVTKMQAQGSGLA